MNSGAMFGNLDRYASYDYWKAHPRVFFQTPEGMEEYRIAAVLKADVSMFDFRQAFFHSLMAFCVWRRRRRRFAWPMSRAMP